MGTALHTGPLGTVNSKSPARIGSPTAPMFGSADALGTGDEDERASVRDRCADRTAKPSPASAQQASSVSTATPAPNPIHNPVSDRFGGGGG
jgi:hypothetical protein